MCRFIEAKRVEKKSYSIAGNVIKLRKKQKSIQTRNGKGGFFDVIYISFLFICFLILVFWNVFTTKFLIKTYFRYDNNKNA